jgi:hypothetical protein
MVLQIMQLSIELLILSNGSNRDCGAVVDSRETDQVWSVMAHGWIRILATKLRSF